MEEEFSEIPDLKDIPTSVKILFAMALIFAFLSLDMTPKEMIAV